MTPLGGTESPLRVMFVVTEDWYFRSHRLPVARALRDAGCRVAVACRVAGHGAAIESEGFALFPLPLSRRSLGPLHLAASIRHIARAYRAFRPDIVHLVALKPAVLGGLAARLTGVPGRVAAIAGLGYTFSSRRLQARLLRPALALLLRAALGGRRARVIVQNDDDGRVLAAAGIVDPARLAVIRGSGVDLARFRPVPEPPGPVRAVMVSRLIAEKGVRELVAAARLLALRGVPVRVALAGTPDPENPSSIPADEIAAWAREGTVETLGHVADVPRLWADSHIAVLPSYYGEGVPLALIEAAAAGRPMIAADGPGLRDIVRHGETGLLVPPRDAGALGDAIARLAGDANLRARMGAAARRLAEERFGTESVVRETLALYAGLAQDLRR